MSESEDSKKYPIAEVFMSPQGEGLFSGTAMLFVRLAGCSVGKKLTVAQRKDMNPTSLYELPVYTELCHTYAGIPFLCDTDFRTKEVLTSEEILARLPEGVTHICITGGEPLNHDLVPLLQLIGGHGLYAHIETSGTVRISDDLHPYVCMRRSWVTVSPKLGVLPEMLRDADEIKLLVDDKFDLEKAIALITSTHSSSDRLVYVQPINFENDLNSENVRRCLEIQKKMPQWRISLQAHKILKVR